MTLSKWFPVEAVNGWYQYATAQLGLKLNDTLLWLASSAGLYPATDGGADLGGTSNRVGVAYAQRINLKGTGVSDTVAQVISGDGDPETHVTAGPGSIYLRTGSSAALYFKDTGTGNTGWTVRT